MSLENGQLTLMMKGLIHSLLSMTIKKWDGILLIKRVRTPIKEDALRALSRLLVSLLILLSLSFLTAIIEKETIICSRLRTEKKRIHLKIYSL